MIVKQENTGNDDSEDMDGYATMEDEDGRYATMEDEDGRVLFCCKVCSRQFESKTGLCNHMRGHIKGNEFDH